MKAKVLLILLLASALAGCSVFSKTSATPLPTVVLDSGGAVPQTSSSSLPLESGGGVTASGIVVPAKQVQVSSAQATTVQSVDVTEGSQVKAGQVMVRLGGREKASAALEAAKIELLTAQQALNELKNNANKARSDAQLRLANAQKALEEAQKRRTWRQYRNGSQSMIETAQADLVMAKNTLDQAQDSFSAVEGKGEDDLNRAAALSTLAAARKAYDKALANLNYLKAMPNQIEVDQAEATLQAAKAELDTAQKEFDKLKNGPDPDALQLAEARVTNAQAQIDASQATLNDLELKAPFDCTIVSISVHDGEWVIPGQAILLLADLSRLRVETKDLSERDVPAIKVGQAVRVLVKPLNQEIMGHVSEISPLADTLGGDVVYKTRLDLDTIPPGLRAGMSVEVSFEASK